jgi:hypothetical protein
MLIIYQTLALRLRTHPLIHLSLSQDHPLILAPLTSLRTLINQSLDCVDITRWTGDRSSAPFISSQLHLLHSLILEALALLKGPPLLAPTNPTPGSTPPHNAPSNSSEWTTSPPDLSTFVPPLPPSLSLDITLSDSSLVLTTRVLEPTSIQPNLGERFAFAIGAQRRLEHDEMDEVFVFRGEEVRVREKVRVEWSADPSLLSLGAKLGALERTVHGARVGLGVVTGLSDVVEE